MSSLVNKKGENFFRDLLDSRKNITVKSSLLDKKGKAAAELLPSVPVPTTRHEEWKYTNLRSLYKESFLPFESVSDKISETALKSFLISEAEGSRIVFVNGVYDESLSSISDLPEGVVFTTLADAVEKYSDIIESELGNHANLKDDPFIPLNTAFCQDGIFLSIPKETKVEQPIHMVYLSTRQQEPYFTTPRNLILGDSFSKFTLVEDYIGLGENIYLTVPVTEIKLQDGASMLHVKLQRESKNAFHISRIGTDLYRNSTYESYSIQIGSQLSRNDVQASLQGEQIDCTLDGLVMVNGNQLSDTHTKIDHLKPYCTSHQLHKCIIEGYGHSVFNGKIYVHKDAQKTDSFQENRNILLSENGTVDTKPQLEIYADDVKCSHGATVGQLDQDEVFYLKSRGLDDEKAQELLSYGFALQIIEQIPVASVRKQLSEAVSRFTLRSQEIMDLA